MPDWLIGVIANVVCDVGLFLLVFAFCRIVHRLWGDRGLAWLLGKPVDEPACRRPPVSSRD